MPSGFIYGRGVSVRLGGRTAPRSPANGEHFGTRRERRFGNDGWRSDLADGQPPASIPLNETRRAASSRSRSVRFGRHRMGTRPDAGDWPRLRSCDWNTRRCAGNSRDGPLELRRQVSKEPGGGQSIRSYPPVRVATMCAPGATLRTQQSAALTALGRVGRRRFNLSGAMPSGRGFKRDGHTSAGQTTEQSIFSAARSWSATGGC